MHKIADIFSRHGKSDDAFSGESPFNIGPQDFYKYRKQRGVNLGSWFTLERWICDAPFQQAQHPAQSDYDVASGPGAKEILERHWDSWIVEEDWQWISERGINTVRIPIGFYHVCGVDPSVLHDTDFAQFLSVFEGAWSRIINAIDTASKHGIGVLIDLHAAPGKQNGDAHSGKTGAIRFYDSGNMARTQTALLVLAKELRAKINVVGLQLLNEPQNNGKLPGWYTSTIEAVHKTAPGLPLYIHDAWSTRQYAELVGTRAEFVVVDHHLYRCFTSDDQRHSGDEHARVLREKTSGEFSANADKCRGNLVVAEFSAALNPASMHGDAGEQDRQRRVFAQAQLELYERHCAGWFFWTYKKGGWDAGWSLKDTVRAEIMPNWVGIRRRPGVEIRSDSVKRDAAKEKALGDHSAYWDQYKGNYEHWRFADGFVKGWEDAYLFFSNDQGSSVPELGFKGEWARRRLSDHVKEKGSSKCLWEYEHGFGQGVDGATKAFAESY